MSGQIGENIAYYRKGKGLTQEQLGEIVGVTGQAVSKWENGGVPDTFLLPIIAKTLGVTIDTLFGVEKKIEDMSESEIYDIMFHFCNNKQYNHHQKDFYEFLLRVVWSMQCSYLGNKELSSLDEVIEKNVENPQITSQIIDNGGTTYLSLVKGFPFFCVVKDDPDISEKILNEEYFPDLFSLFADKDALKAIIFTQTSTKTNQYTAKAMAENIGISLQKFNEIAPRLVKYGLLNADSLSIDDKSITIYHKWSNPEIRPILMMAYQFIHARQCYYNFSCNRTKPYFEVI